MKFNRIEDMDLDGKVVLTRVDLNVPTDDGKVTDTTRIDKIVPTVRAIQDAGGKVVLMAHFDRPKGKRVDGMSLEQIQPALEAALEQKVTFASEAVGGPAKRAVAAMQPGDVVLLENTRFYPGEESNDPTFAASLAALGEIYVNDAFSAAHRAHASTEGLAQLLPSAAGKLMEAELDALNAALGDPVRPVVAVVGGAKVSTKLDLLSNLIEKVDHLVIGGGMANPSSRRAGGQIAGRTRHGRNGERHSRQGGRDRLHDPSANRCGRGTRVQGGRRVRNRARRCLPARCDDPRCRFRDRAGDQRRFRQLQDADLERSARRVRDRPVRQRHQRRRTRGRPLDPRGQADLGRGRRQPVAALNKAGVAGDFTFISTAGGAFLEWMEGKDLPGVAALADGRQ